MIMNPLMLPRGILPSIASCPLMSRKRKSHACKSSIETANSTANRHSNGNGASSPALERVSICTARTCRRQGSQEIFKFADGLQLDGVTVKAVGCMANCGDGPNIGIDTTGVVLNRISTPARFREAIQEVAGVVISLDMLKVTELRLEGNTLARGGDLEAAVERYTEALALAVPTGKHLLYANRAGALLTLGDKQGAVDDANAAAECGPPSFTTAYVRQVEAYAALEQYGAASEALQAGGECFPDFIRSPEYKSMRKQLDKLLQ